MDPSAFEAWRKGRGSKDNKTSQTSMLAQHAPARAFPFFTYTYYRHATKLVLAKNAVPPVSLSAAGFGSLLESLGASEEEGVTSNTASFFTF